MNLDGSPKYVLAPFITETGSTGKFIVGIQLPTMKDAKAFIAEAVRLQHDDTIRFRATMDFGTPEDTRCGLCSAPYEGDSSVFWLVANRNKCEAPICADCEQVWSYDHETLSYSKE